MKKSSYIKMIRAFRHFLHQEIAGGVLLAGAAALAIIMANSWFADFYNGFLHMHVSVRIGEAQLDKTMHHWINDGLMAIFFFLVGLEIKREVVAGELSSLSRAGLPALAAIGGMAVPALIFVLINRNHPEHLHGWAIPSATDIAFALGIVSLLRDRIPPAIRVLLLAIAVIDDLLAIIIIAFFYTTNLSLLALSLAGGCVLVLLALNRTGVTRPAAYILTGFVLWVAVLESGVHATLAGVVAALFIPLRSPRNPEVQLLQNMEKALHSWVVLGILPAFAFANAGVSLAGISVGNLLDPLPLGIIAGLFVGKQLGIFATLYAAVKIGISPMPRDTTWLQLYGVSLLCGIGFTMSLFIGMLAYRDPTLLTDVRLGVLAGSLISATAGYFVLRASGKPQRRKKTV